MAKYFDEKKWTEALQHVDWYLRIIDDYKRLLKQADESDRETREAIKEEIYQFFETHLAQGDIALGREGPNWDAERKPIDTIVIHHTKNPPGITWQRGNAMHLIRLYAMYYASPVAHEMFIKGQPIYSGHFHDARQVFYAYHWFIRMDGSAERLLNDNETGWHAGKWEVNCRSVAICLDNDYEDTTPTDAVISATARLIKTYYPHVRAENTLGHREVNPKTTCPGNTFLSGWKRQLFEAVGEA